MERKVGEIFEYNGVKLKVVREDVPFRCEDCYFQDLDASCEKISCLWRERRDNENVIFKEIKKKNMTTEEYKKKINELKEAKYALNAQVDQVNAEFGDFLLRQLEGQGITPGTKVLVKSTFGGDEFDTETYFFGVGMVFDKMRHVFRKIKKDGTMSQINQYIDGEIISIHKI